MYKREHIDFTYVAGDATAETLAQKLEIVLAEKPRGICLSPVVADYVLQDEYLDDLFLKVQEENILRQFVLDFPLGQGGEYAKSTIAQLLCKEGVVDEFDVVANIGSILSNDFAAFSRELKPVIGLGLPVKVIVETGYYSNDSEIIERVLDWCVRVGAFAIKTSTTVVASIDSEMKRHHVAFWRFLIDSRGYPIKIKASGGQRTREDIDAMLAAGADIIGTSSVIS